MRPSSETVEIREKAELPGRLRGLSLPAQVWVLAIWPFLEQVLNFAVNLVDLVLAGRLETEEQSIAAVGAIGAAGFVAWLIAVVMGTLGTGAGALVARAVGASHRGLAQAALGQAMMASGLLGVVVGIIAFIAAPSFAHLIGLDGQGFVMGVTYLRIVATVTPAVALLFVGTACLRSAGDTRTPFITMAVVNVVNVAISCLLVFGPAPLGGHGVAGIAIGTACAWVLGAVIVVAVVLWPNNRVLRLRLHRLWPHRQTLGRILHVGIPAFLENAMGTWLATFAVAIMVGSLGGTTSLGAHMLAIRIEAISFQPGFALGVAAATLAGQYLGLGDPARARQAVMLCWGAGVVVMGAVGIVFVAAPAMLVGIIADVPMLVEQAAPLVRICGYVQVGFATYLVLSFALRGAGDTRTTMWITFACVYGVRVPGAYVLGIWMGWGLVGVWIALCSDLTLKGICFGWRFLQGGWIRVKV